MVEGHSHLSLNRLIETQDPKNTLGNIEKNPPSIDLSKNASKVFTNPPLLLQVIVKLNASLL